MLALVLDYVADAHGDFFFRRSLPLSGRFVVSRTTQKSAQAVAAQNVVVLLDVLAVCNVLSRLQVRPLRRRKLML